MKRTIICIIIFILLILSGIFSNYYIHNLTEEVVDLIEEVLKYEAEEDHEKSFLSASKATDRWIGFFESNLIFSDREHLMEITKSLVKIRYLSQNGGDLLKSECHTVLFLLDMYLDQQRITLQSVI